MRSLLRLLLPSVLAFAFAFAALVPGSAAAAGPGSTSLVSRPDGNGPVAAGFENHSRTPGALSDDGRYAVFTSGADGFAPGGDTNVENVFLRDTQTGTTTLVTRSDGADGVGANAGAEEPDVTVSPAGHVLVAFATRATNLSDHASGPVTPPAGVEEVWLRDVTAGTTSLVSRVGTNGAPADQDSSAPSVGVTDGGPVVAFQSSARNLGATVRNGGIYLRTVDAHTTALISCKNRDCSGTPSADDSIRPDLRVVGVAPSTPCIPALHPSGSCVLIAFDTIDATISGNSIRQIVLAAATAPASSGTPTAAPNAWFVPTQRTDGKFANAFSGPAEISSDGMRSRSRAARRT